jgi:hypothetical protein
VDFGHPPATFVNFYSAQTVLESDKPDSLEERFAKARSSMALRTYLMDKN